MYVEINFAHKKQLVNFQIVMKAISQQILSFHLIFRYISPSKFKSHTLYYISKCIKVSINVCFNKSIQNLLLILLAISARVAFGLAYINHVIQPLCSDNTFILYLPSLLSRRPPIFSPIISLFQELQIKFLGSKPLELKTTIIWYF